MDKRALATAIAVGRVAFGVGFLLAPGALGRRWVGRAAHEPDTQVVVRALGARDAALGLALLGTMRATGTSGTGFQVLTGLAIGCDVVDALATAAAAEDVPNPWVSVAIATAGAAAGAAVLTMSDEE